MPTTDEMKAAVAAYTGAHTAGDIDGIVALFAADAVLLDPIDKPAHIGTAAIRDFFAGTHQMADSLELRITGSIRAVDRFAAVPLQVVTSIGDTQLSLEIIDVFTFDDDGRIAEMRAYWSESDITTLA